MKIRHKITGKVIFDDSKDNLRGANLCHANLRGANLRGANLCGADLCNAYLRGADLCHANLCHANLRGANLCHANLCHADLCHADLLDANLRGANLRGADLRGANLRHADLLDADLHGANLRGANLRGANLRGANLYDAKGITETYIAPESGAFDAWKKCQNDVLVKLRIPASARRSNATGRKCRAEYVKVLEVIGASRGVTNKFGSVTYYRKGETVRCHKWDDNRWNECSGGIHFFMTRAEAEAW